MAESASIDLTMDIGRPVLRIAAYALSIQTWLSWKAAPP
jgi:hypothetical protein